MRVTTEKLKVVPETQKSQNVYKYFEFCIFPEIWSSGTTFTSLYAKRTSIESRSAKVKYKNRYVCKMVLFTEQILNVFYIFYITALVVFYDYVI